MFTYGVLSLGTSGVYVMLALGIVVIYRGCGLVNFAQGAMAMVGAFVYVHLDVESGWPYLASAATAIVVVAAIGAAFQIMVLYPLRNASSTMRLIATLGLLSVLQEAAVVWFGTTTKTVAAELPTDTWRIYGVSVGSDRVILFLIGAGLSGLLWLVYRYSGFGRRTSAAAENPLAIRALGYSPHMIAAINWALGSALAALAGILLAPQTGVSITAYTELVLPALAAGILGGMVSFPLALLGGLVVGVAQTEVGGYVTQPGWSEAAPFLLVVLILIVRGQGVRERTHSVERLPRVGSGRVRPIVVALAVAIGVVAILAFSPNWVAATSLTFSTAIVLLSLVVVVGYSGQLSLAQYTIAGLGALFAGQLVDAGHLTFVLAAVLALIFVIPVGLVFGGIALRTRGISLSIATLGLAVSLETVVFANTDWTGGADGINVGSLSIFGLNIDPLLHPHRYATFAFLCFVGVAILVANLRRGRTGRALLAARANERAASSLGIDVVGIRLYAFVIGGVIAAIGGIVGAFTVPTLNFGLYTADGSIQLIILLVIGGIGWVTGGVIGAIAQVGSFATLLLDYISPHVQTWVPLATAVLLLLVLLQAPDGLSYFYSVRAKAAWDRFKPARFRRTSRALDSLVEQTESAYRSTGATLTASNVSVSFGGVHALQDLSLEIAPGRVLGIIGPNGAGKTTLIDALTGYVRPQGGEVRLDGRDLTGLSPTKRSRAGLTRSFQSIELFEDMTVLENIRVASDRRSWGQYIGDLFLPRSLPLSAPAVAAIKEFRLEPYLSEYPPALPHGVRHLVGLARAVASGPSVLLLDEPAAGLDEWAVEELQLLIRRLADRWNIGVLLIEHHVEMVLAVCDEVHVLNFGQEISRGEPAAVRADQAVVSAYLGADD